MQDFLKWLFPHGIGTRATIAFIVILAGIRTLEPAAMKEIILVILGFYFIARGISGNGGPPAPPPVPQTP